MNQKPRRPGESEAPGLLTFRKIPGANPIPEAEAKPHAITVAVCHRDWKEVAQGTDAGNPNGCLAI